MIAWISIILGSISMGIFIYYTFRIYVEHKQFSTLDPNNYLQKIKYFFKNFYSIMASPFRKLKKLFRRNKKNKKNKKKLFKDNNRFLIIMKKISKLFGWIFFFAPRIARMSIWSFKKNRRMKRFNIKFEKKHWWKRLKSWFKRLFSKKHKKKDILEALQNGEEINESYEVLKTLNEFVWDEVFVSDLTPLFIIYDIAKKEQLKKTKIQLVSIVQEWDGYQKIKDIEFDQSNNIVGFKEDSVIFNYIQNKLKIIDKIFVFENVYIEKHKDNYRMEMIEDEFVRPEKENKTTGEHQKDGPVKANYNSI